MSSLVLHHIPTEQLPTEWVKQLPLGNKYKIVVEAEDIEEAQTTIFKPEPFARALRALRQQIETENVKIDMSVFKNDRTADEPREINP